MGLLRFVFRNWPLKLAAVLLATLLYAGIIVSATTETYPGRVRIEIRNTPVGAIVLGSVADVESIRYLILGTGDRTISTSSFSAWIDLSGITITPGMPPVPVSVHVQATDQSNVQVLDYSPASIQVTLDPITTKTVPVHVDKGTVPAGVNPLPPTSDPATVTVSGPASRVQTVTAARASVNIDPSGLNVNQLVSLVAVDALGNAVDSVTLTPDSSRVRIQVDSKSTTRTLPIRPVTSGVPAAHVSVTGISVLPVAVTVQGTPDLLAPLATIDTLPVSVEGATADVGATVGLSLPDGVTVVGAATVKVNVTLERDIGSKDFLVGVSLLNANSATTYDLAVNQVTITLGGPISALDALDPATLSVTLDVGGLEPGTRRVMARISVPSTLTLVSISPPEVSVTVTPAPTPEPSPSPTPEPSGSPAPTPSGSPRPTPSPAP